MNAFATNLIYLRGERNLTQQELGDVVGVSPSQISRYEAGTARPRKTILGKLAGALGVAPGVLENPFSDEVRMQSKDGGAQAARAAISFALETENGLQFLRCWNAGDFASIRKNWPEAPMDVFNGVTS
ncbi:helix-turn-helix transcriptional regulator [Pseudomonas sp. WS 5027]|uniref:helix-turn-helix domain-containing protein n=1 Tax=unclassified Pseudomonas TaxID=196821 RepID=UPI001472A0F7|nr:helix-turn-helix transcriptional regulator [Pseudomonas sp. WS 5086]NMY47102.1 helix-turn-helix transcriptional regulator [Pseudomonas sp. WS 5027]